MKNHAYMILALLVSASLSINLKVMISIVNPVSDAAAESVSPVEWRSASGKSEQSSKHVATFNDAYEIKSVGSVSANPAAKLIAIEVQGSILVLNADNGHVVHRLEGQQPSWSPDGRQIAFFSSRTGFRQLHVWNRLTATETPITQVPRGISPNGWASSDICDSLAVSWAPDSRRLVFGSRLLGKGTENKESSQGVVDVRVYDADTPLNHSLVDGVFNRPSYWDVYRPGNPDFGEIMKEIDNEPKLAKSELLIVDTERRSLQVLSGEATQYVCPSWSPDGNTIAAVADTTVKRPFNYHAAAASIWTSALALFDVRSGKASQLKVPAERIGKPMWSLGGDRIVMLYQSKPGMYTFSRILDYGVKTREFRVIRTPGDRAALSVRWSIDRKNLLVKLAGRFIDDLWKINPINGDPKALQTFDWQVGWGTSSFDELGIDTVSFFASSQQFSGRLILARESERDPKILFDANPQTSDLILGEQRRLTWKNGAGDDVDGLLILPPSYKAGKTYPVIVNAYPRPAWDDFRLSASAEDTGQLMAAQGYVIFRPAIRAPHGIYYFTRTEEYMEKARGVAGIPIMVDDFESGIKHLVNIGIADRSRIGIFGHSNGGWVANFLITESPTIRAAAISSGISNLVMQSFWPFPLMTRGVDPASNGNVFDNLSDYVKLSPIFKMREVDIPVLLMVGDQDWDWLGQMISQYGVLRSESKEVQLIRYAHEGHYLTRRGNIEDAMGRIIKFYGTHLNHQNELTLSQR